MKRQIQPDEWISRPLEFYGTRAGQPDYGKWQKYKITLLRCGQNCKYLRAVNVSNKQVFITLHQDHVQRIFDGKERYARSDSVYLPAGASVPQHSLEIVAKQTERIIRTRTSRLGGTTKKAQAAEIYAVMKSQGATRKQIIASFKQKLDMTDAGASTYYQMMAK